VSAEQAAVSSRNGLADGAAVMRNQDDSWRGAKRTEMMGSALLWLPVTLGDQPIGVPWLEAMPKSSRSLLERSTT
jgi:hypothetical protein